MANAVTCLSVSELNERAREALSAGLGPDVWVVGEIHGLKAHAKSGHIYFDLVEKPVTASDQYIAKVSCAFFRGSYVSWQRSLSSLGIQGFELTSGIAVKLRARVDLFVKEGRYQLIVSEIDPSYTLGAIARRRAQTIETMKAGGLMERNKVLELSAVPLHIGLITSRGSAAYQDFTSIILKSGFSFRITLYDAHMQGESTIKEVTQGIRALEKYPDVDAIVIIRGGGAKTDLFVFDDIGLCRTIATCSKPVFTGIGHEIDLSVADMVAHSYFVTPTDAARFFVSQVEGVCSFLEEASATLNYSVLSALNKSSQRLGLAANRLAFLSQRYSSRARSALEAAASALLTNGLTMMATHDRRLLKVLSAFIHQATTAIHGQSSILDQAFFGLKINSSALLKHLRSELQRRHALMLKEISGGLAENLKTLTSYEKELHLLEPGFTLQRGYSITQDKTGRALRDSSHVARDDRITTVLAKGKIHSVVHTKEP
jgi:exodeoxyribonuclease VII large subunit